LLAHLPNHEARRAFQLGWAAKKNGELIGLAEAAGFDLLVTTDQNLLYQQNLRQRKIGSFILGRGNWPEIKTHAEGIAAAINTAKPPDIHFFKIDPAP